MARQLSQRVFTYWLNLLRSMWDGHSNSGTALRDDLKTELEAAKNTFPGHVNTYTSLWAQRRTAKGEATVLQEQGIIALMDVRYALESQFPDEKQRQIALQLYKVKNIPSSRPAVASALQKIGELAAEQTKDAWKPDAELLTTIAGLTTDLQQKMDEIKTLKSDWEEARRALLAAVDRNINLRERIHAYLARVLPGGKNDHLLLDYGLRKKFRRGHSKPQVTVVNEEAIEEESTPETS